MPHHRARAEPPRTAQAGRPWRKWTSRLRCFDAGAARPRPGFPRPVRSRSRPCVEAGGNPPAEDLPADRPHARLPRYPGRTARGAAPGHGEDRLTGARWSTPLQPPDDRASHVVRERQPILAVALAVDRDFTQTPVDVVEPQRGDLPSAQPKTC